MSPSPPAVVHVTCTHPADDGRITAKELGTLLERAGEAWIVALPPAGPLDPRLHWLEAPPYRRFSRPREPWPGLDAAIRRTPEPRIVHAHEPTTVIAAIRHGWTDRRHLIYDAHEYHGQMCSQHARGLKRPLIRRLGDRHDRLAARMAGTVITVNAELAAHYRRFNDHVIEIPNAPLDLEDARLASLAAHRDPRRIIYMGSLTVPRGSRTMIKAFAEIRQQRPDATLELIGAVGDAETTRALATNPEGVVTRGRLAADDATDRLPAGAIGLIPFEAVPRYGVRPVKLLEYAMAGLAIVCSDGGEKAAWVRRHGAGAVVPSGDPSALRDEVLARLDDPSRAREEGSRARAAARTETWPRISAPPLLDLYERLGR